MRFCDPISHEKKIHVNKNLKKTEERVQKKRRNKETPKMAKGTKKGGPTALQQEINSEEEWSDILSQRGLLLVDVFSEWSGPCSAMISMLRRIKMDVGNILNYAVAMNNNIEDLKRFRGKSEPTWMFIENGKMVNLLIGGDCPKLRKTILAEVKRVQNGDEPNWTIPVDQRSPEESSKFMREESIRKAILDTETSKIEQEKRAIYEEYLYYMICELSEETILILYPWVFLDEAGHQRDRDKCPPYSELIHDILPDRFDVLEQSRMQLNEEMLKKMFVEYDVEVTEEMVQGLTDGKVLALRLKARPPPQDWPVPYPFQCPKSEKPCPTRAPDDAENFLKFILEEKFPGDDEGSEALSFLDRHKFVCLVEEEDDESEEKIEREIVYSSVWFPPQARNKVHVFKTLFPTYIEMSHPYEEPVQPAPLCAFKFDATKIKSVLENYNNYEEAIEKFGVFEYDDWHARRLASTPTDFLEKIKAPDGNEIFIFIIHRINDEIFLAFAGNEPYAIIEDEEKVDEISRLFFPDGAEDFQPPDITQLPELNEELEDSREEIDESEQELND